jgi:hypothetical protein
MVAQGNTIPTPYRISGHESFPCRYTWLPKAVRGLRENPRLFAGGDDGAMVTLGVGKNMVRSVRFWSQAAGEVRPVGKGEGHSLSDFGRAVVYSRPQEELRVQRMQRKFESLLAQHGRLGLGAVSLALWNTMEEGESATS